ncbi:MAG: PD40 domain-containing protein [Acidobacteria bacterium]|nr:PD40 domain-containing protein [Acidobacteriota bacterium]
MRSALALLALFTCIVNVGPLGPPAISGAQSVPTLQSLYSSTAPQIDGRFAPGEWDGVPYHGFLFSMVSTATGEAGRTIPGDLYLMHDAAHLYLAIKLYQVEYHNRYQEPALFDALLLLFDNNNDGVVDRLEDRKFVVSLQPTTGAGQRGYYSDEHFTTEEGESSVDLHIDGMARIVHSDPGSIGDYAIEMAVPLNSGYPDDISLTPGAKVKFNILLATACCGSQFEIGAFFTLSDVESRDWGFLQLEGGPPAPPPAKSLPPGKIAFITPELHGRDEVYVMNSDGTGLRRLTDNDQAKNWVSLSRDRRKVVYVESSPTRPDSAEIWTIDLESVFFSRRRLTFDNAAESRPSFSPDGGRIVFSRQGEIWTMRSDGGLQRPITSNQVEDSEPDWGPSGRIVFRTGRFGDRVQLAIMDSDGSNVIRLTNGRGQDQLPAFTSDGQRVAFMRYEGPGEFYDYLVSIYHPWNIYSIATDGAGEQALTDDGLVNWRPVPAPDGLTVLYQKTTDLFTLCTRVFSTTVPSKDGEQVLKLLSRVRYFDFK